MKKECFALIGAALLVANHALAKAGEAAEEAASPMAVAQLDGFALGLAQAEAFSGVLLVARDGEILLERAYGKRDSREDHENTVDTRFNLASAGKMFTAVAILQQVAAGRITLDTSVGEVLRDYPNQDFATQVTIRHLLTHTAGAGDIDLFGVENAKNRDSVHSVADMMALHAHRPPAFPPGSSQEYGNFGHVVLGRIVEVLSGQSFEAYIQDHVFGPSGMSRTAFVDCPDNAADIAVGYVELDGEQKLNCETLPRRGFPAGGQVSTARDMFKFVEALRAGKLLPAALFSEAIRPQREFMGLGFFATEYGPGYPKRNFRWGHAGSADGICTDVRTYPLTGETVIALSNTDVPGCFEVTNFLHRQWELRHKVGEDHRPDNQPQALEAAPDSSFRPTPVRGAA
ncbi:serine hydrolase domain-containing protein [Pseudoxanthomonas koreensis]|uniref:serine hydrolase domain-containing protein n=1 Tax=Pseudoxanthomonas koreensis TaxID=266061 RepID=UPI001391FD26|nr:serine hydrolase domain-containing protein [Pseudoxanthomonas koreensis]